MRNGLSDSDERIIGRIKQGEERRAYNELYRRCYPAIARRISQNSGSEEDAQDIFQNAIIKFLEKKDRLTLIASICTYLFSIAWNLWLKKLRDEQRLPLVKLPIGEDIIDDTESSVDDERDLDERQQIALECLQELGETAKTILHRFYFDGSTHAEIAAMTRLRNRDVAKNLKARYLRELRDCVKRKMSRLQ